MRKIIPNTYLSKSRFTLLAIIMAALAINTQIFAFAHASSEPKKEEKAGAAQSNKVEIPGVVIPVANGQRLVNYAFLTIIVHTSDARGSDLVRNNTFLVKDAVVRGAARSPISVGANNFIDNNAVALWLRGIVQGALNGVVVTRVEIKSLDLMR